jgi:hypothetical protein
MTETEVAVKLEAHEHEIKSLKHRVSDQEEQSKTIQELVLAVKELALNMQAMLKEQASQGARLAKLEAAPGEAYNSFKRTFTNRFVDIIAGALATGIIILIYQNLK